MRIVAAALVLAASLTACSSGDDDPTLTAPTDTPTSAAPATAAAGGLTVSGRDFSFIGLEGFTAKAGTPVPFTFKNISSDSQHDFVVRDAAGNQVGGTDVIGPGETATGTLTFAKAGTYTFLCTVGRHEEQGMAGTLTVS
jgi:plastocyanin